MKLTSNTYQVMTKYLFFSNFTRDMGMSAFISAVLFGSGYYVFSNYDALKVLFVVDEKEEENDEFVEDDVSPKPLLAIKNEPENKPEKKSWFWFM